MKLLHKLLLLVFCATLIPIGLAAVFLSSYRAQTRNSVMTLQKNVVQLSALMAEREMQGLSRRFDRIESAAASEKHAGSGGTSVYAGNISREKLFSLLEQNPEFLFFAVADRNGNAIQSGGDPEFVRLFGNARADEDELFLKAKATGSAAVGDFENMFNLPACRIVYPCGQGRYVFAIVNLRDIAEKLEQTKFNSGGLLLADSAGNAIFFSPALEKFSKETIKSMTAADGIFQVSRDRGVNKYLVVSAKVGNTGLYLLGVRSIEEAFSGLNRMSWLMAFLALAVATALYFSAIVFARQAAHPLEALAAAAKRISREDFSSPIETESEFLELSELIDSVNVMMGELKRYHGIHLEQIFEEKQKLEMLVSLISDGIIFCGFDGGLIYANRPAMEIIGAGSDPEEQRRKIRRLAKEKSGGIISISSGGAEKWYSVNIRSVTPKTEAPSVFITLHDITLERELQQVKEDFFNSAAHDLRAPLLSMQGYIKLLEYTAKEEKQQEYVKNLNDSSKRLFTLIENILDFSRLDSGSFHVNTQELCLSDFFDDIIRSFKPVIEQHGIKFKHENLLPEGTVFEADPDLFRRVADNLISNAVKFTPAGGSIAFRVEEAAKDIIYAGGDRKKKTAGPAEIKKDKKGKKTGHGKRLMFTISDTGPGIPENRRKEIFDKYRQIGNKKEKGFGLGLAISKKIVELHGGRIWADSGSGAVFRFII